MNIIDICITATLRHNILNQTLKSFFKNVISSYQYRFIVNIDCIGDKKSTPNDIIETLKKYPSINIKYRISEKSSFPKAVMWCWSQIQNDIVFHLEDDWIFLRPFNLDSVINLHRNNFQLASLKLSKFDLTQINQDYILEDKLSLNPNFIKKKFIDEILPYLVETKNPEKQLRCDGSLREPIIRKWKYGIYTKDGDKKIVEDVGRSWMRDTKFEKGKNDFVTWSKKRVV